MLTQPVLTSARAQHPILLLLVSNVRSTGGTDMLGEHVAQVCSAHVQHQPHGLKHVLAVAGDQRLALVLVRSAANLFPLFGSRLSHRMLAADMR